MSRHSKWSKVKQSKGAIDTKRSASFTKLSHEITIAARDKGADPSMNVSLRVAIDRAKKASLPKDTIQRAIARGSGAGGEDQLDLLTYEAHAPGGTALIIECLTGNRNRSANDVKHLLSEYGASLATMNAVTYMFDRYGVVRIGILEDAEFTSLSADAELALIDAGAFDIVDIDGARDIRSAPNDLANVTDTAQHLGFTIELAEFEWVPKVLVEVDEVIGTTVAELIEVLDSLDDVSRVYSNLV